MLLPALVALLPRALAGCETDEGKPVAGALFEPLGEASAAVHGVLVKEVRHG